MSSFRQSSQRVYFFRLIPLRPPRPKKLKPSTSAEEFDAGTMKADLIEVEIEIGPSILCVYGCLLTNFYNLKVSSIVQVVRWEAKGRHYQSSEFNIQLDPFAFHLTTRFLIVLKSWYNNDTTIYWLLWNHFHIPIHCNVFAGSISYWLYYPRSIVIPSLLWMKIDTIYTLLVSIASDNCITLINTACLPLALSALLSTVL